MTAISTPSYIADGRRVLVTPATIEQLASGALHLTRHGVHVPYRLTRTQYERFNQAKRCGYVVARNADRALRNTYWLWCELTGRIFISADLRARYASIEVDPLAANIELSADAQRQIGIVWQRVATRRARSSINRGYGYCSKISRNQAEHVAARIWQICQDDRKERCP